MLPAFVTGKIVATGAIMNIPIGFLPKHITLFNETTGIGLEWTDTMAVGGGLKTTAAGARSHLSSLGLSLFQGTPGPAALTGTLAVTAANPVVTGTGTKFLTEVKVGDIISIPGVGAPGIGGGATVDEAYGRVVAIASDTSLTCQSAFDYTASGKAAYNTSGIAPGFTLGTDSINVAANVINYIAERTA